MHAESRSGNRATTSTDVSSRLKLVRTAAYRAVTGAWDEPVALACSGGIDSTALLLVASEARSRGKVAPVVVMHVDHGTRPEIASEANFIRGICAGYSIPFVSLRLRQTRRVAGRSDEDLWRDRRYDALGTAAGRMGIRTIVTAHTRDDQIETVLMRLLTGSSQLGMQQRTTREMGLEQVTILRPLLGISRTELLDVLHIAGVEAREDPTNEDTRFRRNAVRHELVPALQRVFPGYDEALLRSAALRNLDAGYVDEQAVAAFDTVRTVDESSGVGLDRHVLLALHPAVATRVVRFAVMSQIAGDDYRELTYERVEAVLDAATGRSGAMIELPYGVRARIDRDVIRFWSISKGGPVG